MKKETDIEQKTDRFREMLDESEYIVFLGGAGVSTESGIPDFRSRNGLYHKTEKHFSKNKPVILRLEMHILILI